MKCDNCANMDGVYVDKLGVERIRCRTMQHIPEDKKWCFTTVNGAILAEEQILTYLRGTPYKGSNMYQLTRDAERNIKRLNELKERKGDSNGILCDNGLLL